MIIDVTGTILIPGNSGKNCPGNGNTPNIECCCDECDYMLCCIFPTTDLQCSLCTDIYCPKAPANE